MKKNVALIVISALAILAILFCVLYISNNAGKSKEIDTLKADLADRDGQIQTLDADVTSKAGEIETLQKDVEGKAGEIKTLTDDATEKAGQIAALTEEAKTKDATIETMTGDLKERDGQIESLNKTVEEKAAEIVLKKDKTRANYYKYHVAGRILLSRFRTYRYDWPNKKRRKNCEHLVGLFYGSCFVSGWKEGKTCSPPSFRRLVAYAKWRCTGN